MLVACEIAASSIARADDAVAQHLFDAAVEAASTNRWAQAAELLEASLAERDMPSARFNLMLAYEALRRPLDVIRQGALFLAAPGTPERAEWRAHAAELVVEARRQVTTLDLGALPSDALLLVDGSPAEVLSRRSYVSPGPHTLEIRPQQGPAQVMHLDLAPGRSISLRLDQAKMAVATKTQPSPPRARAVRQTAQHAEPLRERPMTARTRAAWVIGGLGGALAIVTVACLGVSEARAEQLARGGEAGSTTGGYLSRFDRYTTTRDAITPLSLGTGVLIAASVALGQRSLARGSLAWSIASLVAGGSLLATGLVWAIRKPDTLFEGSRVHTPAHQRGYVLAAASAPLLTYGVGFLVHRQSRLRLALGPQVQLNVTW